ncbi:MAG: 2Fe-2S iron-sulfur cluster binding domain-containing protein [Filomicrobium sp.]
MPQNTKFEVWLVWSDQRIVVPENVSCLDALIAADVPIEPGCRTGGCGECVTQYVEGEVLHKDSCLNDEERKTQFCPCVSRAVGTLVLPF